MLCVRKIGGYLRRRGSKARHEAAFQALDEMETELIALKDVAKIIDKMPMEEPTPVYLIQRVLVHTKSLSARFYQAWDVIVKKKQ